MATLSVPGNSTRYDALFSFSADKPAAPGVALPLGIDAGRFKPDGTYELKKRWLEFKCNLEDLIVQFEAEDGTPGKKYFDLLDLAVAWNATTGPCGDYFVEQYDSVNWPKRSFYGATHFVTKHGSSHVMDVIELSSLTEALADADTELSLR